MVQVLSPRELRCSLDDTASATPCSAAAKNCAVIAAEPTPSSSQGSASSTSTQPPPYSLL